MTFPRAHLAAALTMAVATAAASSLALVGTTRADDTQSGAQSGSSWVPGTTLPLANSKSVEASSVSASTLTFGSSSDEPTKIFVLSSGSSDAILIESGGWYGIIDGGEDADLPDGSDPRYPVRSGTAVAEKSTTDWLMGYLDDQGSTTLTSLSTWAPTRTPTTSPTPTTSSASTARGPSSAPSTPTRGSPTRTACGTTSTSTIS